jgi:hypothetical protein
MAKELTEEQSEDILDSLRAWLTRLGDKGKPGPISDDGEPYTLVTVEFTVGEVESAVEKFKTSVSELQGSNGFYIRVLPELSFDGSKMYKLRTRIAPKETVE